MSRKMLNQWQILTIAALVICLVGVGCPSKRSSVPPTTDEVEAEMNVIEETLE